MPKIVFYVILSMFYAIFCVTNRVFASALMRFLITLYQILNSFWLNGKKPLVVDSRPFLRLQSAQGLIKTEAKKTHFFNSLSLITY